MAKEYRSERLRHFFLVKVHRLTQDELRNTLPQRVLACTEALALVRDAQEEYFRTRGQAELQLAKTIEAEADKALEELLAIGDPKQESLF
jgi:hypothetical protein